MFVRVICVCVFACACASQLFYYNLSSGVCVNQLAELFVCQTDYFVVILILVSEFKSQKINWE